MSEDVRPLPVWPHDMLPGRMELLQQAKSDLALSFKIVPTPAVPGSPGRVLAFSEIPPFFCDTALIRAENVDKLDSVRAAMNFVLTAPADAEGGFTGEMWLSAVMGGPVKLVAIEDLRPAPQHSGPVFY